MSDASGRCCCIPVGTAARLCDVAAVFLSFDARRLASDSSVNTMHRTKPAIASILVISLICTACATTGAGTLYTRGLGQTTMAGFEAATPQILDRYGFRVERSETTRGSLFLETRWTERPLHADEGSMGIGMARDRLTFYGRERPGTGAAGPSTFVIEMRAQTEVRGGEYPEWTTIAPTPDGERYLREIADELVAQYSSRMRGF
jgi:hypothetical protein